MKRRFGFVRQTASDGANAPELTEILRDECMDKARARLTDCFAAWGADGRLKSTNPQAAASMLMDMVFGAAHLEKRNGSDGRAFTRTCIHYFVNGVR
jgi:hypothetical protein